jgi:hypothetical protein
VRALRFGEKAATSNYDVPQWRRIGIAGAEQIAAVFLSALACVVIVASAAWPKFQLLKVLELMMGFGALAVAYHALLARLQR